MRYLIAAVLFMLTITYTYAQVFEGKLSYHLYYIDYKTKKPLFEPKFEIEFQKKSNVKIELPNASDGALELELSDYLNDTKLCVYSNKRIDTSYIVTDEPITYQENGLAKYNRNVKSKKLEKQVKRFTLCSDADSIRSEFIQVDTSFVIAGLESKVVKEVRGGKVIREIYYIDTVKIHPSQYQCNRSDGLSEFYKYSKGSLITQLVVFGELYIYIRQLQSFMPKPLDDTIFSFE